MILQGFAGAFKLVIFDSEKSLSAAPPRGFRACCDSSACRSTLMRAHALQAHWGWSTPCIQELFLSCCHLDSTNNLPISTSRHRCLVITYLDSQHFLIPCLRQPRSVPDRVIHLNSTSRSLPSTSSQTRINQPLATPCFLTANTPGILYVARTTLGSLLRQAPFFQSSGFHSRSSPHPNRGLATFDQNFLCTCIGDR